MTAAWTSCVAALLVSPGLAQQVDRLFDASFTDVGVTAGSEIGFAAAMEGDLVVLSVPFADGTVANSGAVYFWRRSPTGYLQDTVLRPTACYPGGDTTSCAFGLDIALSGDVLSVSSLGGAPSSSSIQLVHLYERRPGAWDLLQILRAVPNTVDSGSGFGFDLALDGDTLAVGASAFEVAPDRPRGAVFVYERGPSGFVLDAMLTGLPQTRPPPFGEEAFGGALDLDGDVLVIGETSRGARVYVYERRGGDWSLVQVLERPGGGSSSTRFGTAVAIEASTGVLVVSDERGIGPFDGQIWIYERSPSTGLFELSETFLPSFPLVTDSSAGFGRVLDVAPGIVVTSAWFSVISGSTVRTGVVEVFERMPQGWERTRLLAPPVTSSSQALGRDVAVADGRVLATDSFWRPDGVTEIGRGLMWEFSSGTEVCAGPDQDVSLELLFDDGSESELTASVRGLLWPGVGYFVAGDPAAATPFGSEALCVGRPMRVSPAISFGFGPVTLYERLEHPDPTAPTSTAFQFVFARPGGPFPVGASSARVVD